MNTGTEIPDHLASNSFLKQHIEAKLKIVQNEFNMKVTELSIYIHSRLAEFATELLTKIESTNDIAPPASNGHTLDEYVDVKLESPPPIVNDFHDDDDGDEDHKNGTIASAHTSHAFALSVPKSDISSSSSVTLLPVAAKSSCKRTKISCTESSKSTTARTYKCDQCDWSFDKPSSLLRHKKTPHTRVCKGDKKESFICDICPKIFFSKPSFNVHRNSHTADRYLQCDICSRTFTLKQSLRIHMRTHTDERPYMCQLCSKTFKQSSPFRRHMRSHNTEKQFKCTMCPRGFHEKIYLKEHMQVHTNERPHICPICKKGYSKRFHLRRHIENFHKIADIDSVLPRKQRRTNNTIYIPPDE